MSSGFVSEGVIESGRQSAASRAEAARALGVLSWIAGTCGGASVVAFNLRPGAYGIGKPSRTCSTLGRITITAISAAREGSAAGPPAGRLHGHPARLWA